MRDLYTWFRKTLPWALIAFSLLLNNVAFAGENNTSSDIYQSAFDDYTADANQKPIDWTEANKPSGSSGHEGHNMKDMAADEMQGMDHSTMSGMDHSNMKDMDHSKMQGMDHSNMKGMDHAQMGKEPSSASGKQEHNQPMRMVDHEAMHDHSHHAYSEVDSSEVSESMPHEHEHGSMPDMNTTPTGAIEEHGSHSHGGDVTNSPTENPSNQPNGFKIIPNLHPAVVHFPIALTLVAFLLGLSAFIVRRLHTSKQTDGESITNYVDAAVHFSLWLAALGAVAAVIFGWLAFNSANHDEAGHLAMLTHRAWAIPTAIGLILVAVWDMVKNGFKKAVSPLLLSLLFLLSVGISATAWLGGEVVYRHGIGVLSIPANQGAGHSHQHGAEGGGSQHEH